MYTPILSSSEKKMIRKGNVIFRNWQLRSAMVVFIYTLFYPLRLEVRLRKIGLRNPRNNFGGFVRSSKRNGWLWNTAAENLEVVSGFVAGNISSLAA